MMAPADMAFAILTAHRDGRARLTRKAGSFLGQLVADPSPLTQAQSDWLGQLAERAGMEAAHG